MAVEPKVFNLITYLLAHRERLVTREEILDNLWKDRVVSDTTISNHIKSARKVLGDDGNKQAIIKTFHGRGYQFIAEIIDNNKSKQTHSNINYMLKYLSLMLVAVIIAIYLIGQGVFLIDSNKHISIAVMAFEDLSKNKDQAYFSDGMSTELIGLLANMKDIHVRDRRSSFFYKGQNVSIQTIANELKVTHIIDGSVRKNGDDVRIDIQLIETEHGINIWSQTFNRKLDNILDIQADIAARVRQQFQLHVVETEIMPYKVNDKAYSLYLQSEFLKFKNDPNLILDAIDLVKESLSIDSNYAPAHLLLAQELVSASLNLQKLPYDQGLNQARIAVHNALALNKKSAPAYALLARLDLNQYSDFVSANNNINKAINLNPNNATVLANANVVLGYSGNLDNTIENHNKLIEMNPKEFVYYRNKGIVQHWLGDLSGAIESFKKYKYYYPQAPIGNAQMVKVYIDMGKFNEALQVAKQETVEHYKQLSLSIAMYALNRKQESETLLIDLIGNSKQVINELIAEVYAYRGDIENTFKYLELSFKRSPADLIEAINYPAFTLVYHDPRWKALLLKLNLPQSHRLLNN
ncbi:MAG: winged helix-turn-helix domain-containing protein [Alcanivoracaceae bacterium]|nr:winged helix-turn-helix domain-containing protein [Alcanivoracaceae bacterium]